MFLFQNYTVDLAFILYLQYFSFSHITRFSIPLKTAKAFYFKQILLSREKQSMKITSVYMYSIFSLTVVQYDYKHHTTLGF